MTSEAEIIKTLAEAEEIRYKAVPINDVDRMVKLIRDELIGQDKLPEITEVAKALAPQPGVLGDSSIYTFANGNGEDINKLMRSTSGIQLIHSLLNGKLGKMLEQRLGDNNEDNEYPHFSPQRRSVKPKSLSHQGLNLVFAQSRNKTVCGESFCRHQNQLDWAQKAIYLA